MAPIVFVPCGIVGLVLAGWLFGSTPNPKSKEALYLEPMPEATHQDYAEFLVYLRRDNRPFMKAGRSVNEEYKMWLAGRARKKAADANATTTPSMEMERAPSAF